MKPSSLPPAGAARKALPPARPSSSGNLLSLALFVVAVILAGVAWWEHGRAVAAEQRVTELEQKIAELERLARMDEPPAIAHTPPLPPPEPMPVEEPPPPPPANQRAAGLAAIGNLLNNPQIQQLAAGVTQGIVTNAYAGFVQQMNMNEEQAAAFNALVAQRAMIGQQVLRDATAQGLDLQANSAQLQQQVRQSEAQVDQQIRGVLGDQGFQQYQDYSRNVQQQFRNGGGLQGFQGGGAP